MTSNQLRTVRRVITNPGIAEDAVGASYDVAGTVRAGLVERRQDGDGTVRLHVTSRGRAAASKSRARVRSGAFR